MEVVFTGSPKINISSGQLIKEDILIHRSQKAIVQLILCQAAIHSIVNEHFVQNYTKRTKKWIFSMVSASKHLFIRIRTVFFLAVSLRNKAINAFKKSCKNMSYYFKSIALGGKKTCLFGTQY